MQPLRYCHEAFCAIKSLFDRSLVRPLTLICLIMLFGAILPMWVGSIPTAWAWSYFNLFQNSDFETGSLSPFTESAGPPGAAFVNNNANRTPSGHYNGQINGAGQNVDLKQRVDGLTAGQRYYLGNFASQNTASTGIAFAWGANPYGYTNCGFSYAVWNRTVDSYAMSSCDNTIPVGYNFVAPKMSYNAASGYWAVTDDWYLLAVPNKTTSHYVDTRDPNSLYNWGLAAGNSGESGVIVLDFGQPWYDGTNYGTWDSWVSPDFISVTDIENLVVDFLIGYWNAQGPTGRYAAVLIGTNNLGQYENYAHGAAWSQIVLDVRNFVQEYNLGSRENVYGASDIEPSFGVPGSVTDWINGYQSVSGYVSYYDFGSADGMPFDVWYFDKNGVGHAGCPTCSQGPNGWTQDNIWYAAWGAIAALPFPEIYRTDGVNASQWYRMSLYALQKSNGASSMVFQAALTEQAACQQNGCAPFCSQNYCASTNNSPGKGWGQLRQFLNFDQSVFNYVTNAPSDITW